MGLEFQLIWAGRHVPAEWEVLGAEYRKRIAAWHPIVERPIKVRSSGEDLARRKRVGVSGDGHRGVRAPRGAQKTLEYRSEHEGRSRAIDLASGPAKSRLVASSPPGPLTPRYLRTL